ncbi:hypothetical protein [Lewinella cohaerens]|uniref:hypothetical protein n=1 Tax=Lewinella cohaerens TaxID=70995 RepID=UPI000365E0DA|nr:hypothetical protein [Lewinella cohaerens]
MTSKYSPLFQIDIQHSYFSSGICPDFQIQPSPVSQRLMSTYGIRLQPTPKGIKVYQGFEDIEGSEAVSKVDTPIVLTFFLKSSDPLFYNYTQLDLITGKKAKPFFSNTLPSDVDGIIPVSITNKAIFTSLHQTINFSPPKEASSITAKLYTITGENFHKEVLDSEVAETGTFQLNIPQDRADEGEFLLNLETEDGQIQEQSLYLLSEQTSSAAVCVVQIVINPSVAQALLNGQGPIYQLDFSPRETIWRYYFTSQDNSADNLKLLKNGEVLTDVAGSTKAQLPNGQEAQVMSLQSPKALREREQDKFELEFTSSHSQGRAIKIQLPAPSPDRLVPEKDENGEQVIFSDIYVYL